MDRLRSLDSCAVSDALDALDLAGATAGIRPLWAVTGPVAGRVRTVQAGPRQSGKPAQHIAAAAIVAAEPGDVPVEIAGHVVYPGDAVLADDNGVVFIPADELERVISLAERIVAREQGMADAVRAGQPVTEVMHDSKFRAIAEAAQ